jgi:serine/threonine protein kinase
MGHFLVLLIESDNWQCLWNTARTAMIVCGRVWGMEFIHSPELVNRDLKPTNVLIDEGDRWQIGDFGSSKFVVPGRVALLGRFIMQDRSCMAIPTGGRSKSSLWFDSE